jgi:hypothetical protein
MSIVIAEMKIAGTEYRVVKEEGELDYDLQTRGINYASPWEFVEGFEVEDTNEGPQEALAFLVPTAWNHATK